MFKFRKRELQHEAALVPLLLSCVIQWHCGLQRADRANCNVQVSLDTVEQQYALSDVARTSSEQAFQNFMASLESDWKDAHGRRTTLTRPGRETLSTEHYRYDPVLLTILAGIESHEYKLIGGAKWVSVMLGPAKRERSPYYGRPVSLHFRPGNPENPRVFVLFGAAYSTWRFGSWINKTLVAIDQAFPSSHLVVMEGFLTPDFLRGRPLVPELSGVAAANDLYQRLGEYFAELQSRGTIPKGFQAGLIGFSGGADLALAILAADSIRGVRHPLFSRGAIAYSPIIDLNAAFHILDDTSRAILAAGFPSNEGLTTFHGAFQLLIHGYTPGHVAAFISLLSSKIAKDRRIEFTFRFYREFTIVDLANIMHAKYAVNPDCPKDPEQGYGTYYEDCVFPLHRRLFGLSSETTFSDYTSFEHLIAPVQSAPVYLVFAQDDPVLAKSTVVPQADSEVPRVLAELRNRSNFRVFTPRRGGHMAYILDSRFLLGSIQAFF
jgi:hypothetical protein